MLHNYLYQLYGFILFSFFYLNYCLRLFAFHLKNFFSVSYKADLLAKKLSQFLFSWNILVLLLFWKIGFFKKYIQHFEYVIPLLSAFVFDEKSVFNLIEISLYMMSYFSFCFRHFIFEFQHSDYNFYGCGFLCVSLTWS